MTAAAAGPITRGTLLCGACLLGLLATVDCTLNDVYLGARATLDAASPAEGKKKRWELGAPSLLAELNSSTWEGDLFLLQDARTLYFSSSRSGGAGGEDIYVASRAGRSAPFGSPAPLFGVNTGAFESIALSRDELTAYLATDRQGGPGGIDIWIGTRPSLATPWESALFTPLSTGTPHDDNDACVDAENRALYFAVRDWPAGLGGQDLVVVTRPRPDDAFGPVSPVAAVNTPFAEADPALSPDGRVLVFTSSRPGGAGSADLWFSVRADRDAPFSDPAPIPDINTAYRDREPFISADGTELFFTSDRPGGKGHDDIYRVQVLATP